MAYFVDPYTSYYSVLSGTSGLGSVVLNIASEISGNSTSLNNINAAISASGWEESGVEELTQNVLPNLKLNNDILSDNVDNSLVNAYDIAMNQLLPELDYLKSEDEILDSNQTSLNSLIEVSEKEDGYNSYISQRNSLIQKIEDSKAKCEKSQKTCDSLVNSIKSLNSAVMDFIFGFSFTSGNSSSEVLQSVEEGNMIKITYNGKEYYVVNTEINCLEYEDYVKRNGLFQNGKIKYENGCLGGICGDECLILSQYYACDMMRGKHTSRDEMSAKTERTYSPYIRMKSEVNSEDPDEVLRYVYEEALAGRPTVLTVSQENSDIDGSRHVVTVVGFDSSIKSFEDFKNNQDKIFVLDCEDGELQTLGQPREEGGHERVLFAWEGKYDARGATETFKDEEIYNEKWLESNSIKRKNKAKENEDSNNA